MVLTKKTARSIINKSLRGSFLRSPERERAKENKARFAAGYCDTSRLYYEDGFVVWRGYWRMIWLETSSSHCIIVMIYLLGPGRKMDLPIRKAKYTEERRLRTTTTIMRSETVHRSARPQAAQERTDRNDSRARTNRSTDCLLFCRTRNSGIFAVCGR